MKKVLTILGMFAFLFLISGCGSTDNDGISSSEDGWTFSLAGSEGVSEVNEDGSYNVIFYDVKNKLNIQKGDIEKQFGINNVSSLEDNWDQVMQYNNNGAWLQHTLEDGSTKGVHVRITNQHYDEEASTFEFTATPVNEGDTIDPYLANVSLGVSYWDYVKLVAYCGADIAAIAAAAIEGGLNPIADALALGASAACVDEIKIIWIDD